MDRSHSRRSVLTGVGALALVSVLPGCTGGQSLLPTAPTTPAVPDPLLAVLAARVALVEDCAAVAVAHPALAGRVRPVGDQTAEQVTTLQRALARPTASASVVAPVTPSVSSGPVVPPDPAAALAGLRAALQAAGEAAAALCRTTSAQRAPLLGSLAAAAAGHAVVLT